MDNEREILLFTDEDGEDIEMEVVDYFEYQDQEYAILTEVDDDCDDECGCGCGCDEKEVYIMKVLVNGDTEEFVPVEDDKMEELIKVIEELYSEGDE